MAPAFYWPWRAAEHLRQASLGNDILRQTEITDQHLFVIGRQGGRPRRGPGQHRGMAARATLKQDIRRLDVARYQIGIVQRAKTGGKRIGKAHQAGDISRRAIRKALQTFFQGIAIGIIHDEVWATIAQPADIMHGYDIRRANATQQARLLDEALLQARITGQIGAQDLDHDQRFQFLVPSQRDHGDATPGNLAAYRITTNERRQRHRLPDPAIHGPIRQAADRRHPYNRKAPDRAHCGHDQPP